MHIKLHLKLHDSRNKLQQNSLGEMLCDVRAIFTVLRFIWQEPQIEKKTAKMKINSAEKIAHIKLNGVCCRWTVCLRMGNVNASHCGKRIYAHTHTHMDQFALEELSNTDTHTHTENLHSGKQQ